MERKTRQTLNTVLGWVGYGLGYSADDDVTVTDGRDANVPRTDTADVEAIPKRVLEIGSWQSRARATEVTTETAPGHVQLAELRDPAEQARAASSASLAALVEDIADLRTQLGALRESTEQARTAQDSEVTGAIADFRTQPGAPRESTEQARTAQDSEATGAIADLSTRLAAKREPTEVARGDGSEPELLPRPEKPSPTASSQPETPSTSTERLEFPNSLAMHLSRFLTRKVRQDTRDSSESDEKPPACEVPIAVERLHGMLQADVERSREIVRSGALDTAPATVAFGEPPDKGRDIHGRGIATDRPAPARGPSNHP